ncbi:G-protein coupled receptor 55 [Triplophysa tibetana]|uniref:G-protein coupled receptor 55 n=1 Tax=Triplophysa tibetana TaxID=1572043 RepID=A0A5A9P9N6_9TELE|nr:G-protein coupled receptor 55 [Triplophysa tibetana]
MFNCSLNHTDVAFNIFERVGYTIVFFAGLILNITVLFIFSRIKHWNDTHIYMLNLLIADFLAIIFLPFRILETFCRLDKTKLCTILVGIQYSNMYCSIFTISAISVQRFLAVRFPFLGRADKAKRQKIAVSVCILIWTTIAVICAMFNQDLKPDYLLTCFNRKAEKKLNLTFFLILEIVGYLVPLAIIILCSTQTIHNLVKSIKHVEKIEGMKRKSIAAVISANMFTFILCFTPIHIGFLLQYLSKDNTLFLFTDVAEWIATTNCCLDSIGYYFLLKRVSRNYAD